MYPASFTIKFDPFDSRHKEVLDLLNTLGRKKANLIVNVFHELAQLRSTSVANLAVSIATDGQTLEHSTLSVALQEPTIAPVRNIPLDVPIIPKAETQTDISKQPNFLLDNMAANLAAFGDWGD